MDTYSLGLALQDYFPVIFSSLGLWAIARLIRRIDPKLGQMALLAWLLITIGGALKATWVLTLALTNGQTDLVFFDKSLFVWLGIGFLIMSYAISYAWRVIDRNSPREQIWRWPLITTVLFFVIAALMGMPNPDENGWRFFFLAVMTVGNVAAAFLLIRQARKQGQGLVALLFTLNITVMFILSGLARTEQTILMQWMSQIFNTIAQIAFWIGGTLLARGTIARLDEKQAGVSQTAPLQPLEPSGVNPVSVV